MQFLKTQRLGKRAQSVDEQVTVFQKPRLPALLTPTFGNWKNNKNQYETNAHPKISHKLYDKFPSRQKETRDLKSEGQMEYKENYHDGTVTTKSTLTQMPIRQDNQGFSADKIFSFEDEQDQLIAQQIRVNLDLYKNPNINQYYKNSKKKQIVITTNQSPLSKSTRINGSQSRKLSETNQYNFQFQQPFIEKKTFNFQDITDSQALEIQDLKDQMQQLEQEQNKQQQELLSQCYDMFEKQKRHYEAIFKNNSIFYKYSKVIKKEHNQQQQQLLNTYNQFTN